jgi:hypothetical protein
MGSIGYIAEKPAGDATVLQKGIETTRGAMASLNSHPKTASIPLPGPYDESNAGDLLEHLVNSLGSMAETLRFVSVACEIGPDSMGYYTKDVAATLAEQAETLKAKADCAYGMLAREWYLNAKTGQGKEGVRS